jgi:hypothetical protein
MISKSNFKIKYPSLFILLALALPATANLGLFIFSTMYFFKQPFSQQPNPQFKTLPIPQTLNSPIPVIPNQLPQVLQKLQDMISQRQLVNVNHIQLALR